MRMPLNAWCTGSHKPVNEIPYGVSQCTVCNKVFTKLQKNGNAPKHRPRYMGKRHEPVSQ